MHMPRYSSSMVKVPPIITSSLAWTTKVEYRKVQYWIEKPVCRTQSYTIHRVAFAMLCLNLICHDSVYRAEGDGNISGFRVRVFSLA